MTPPSAREAVALFRAGIPRLFSRVPGVPAKDDARDSGELPAGDVGTGAGAAGVPGVPLVRAGKSGTRGTSAPEALSLDAVGGNPPIPRRSADAGTRGTRGTLQTDSSPHRECCADWWGWYEELAAVLEYDGGLARAEAEARAFASVAVAWVTAHPAVDALPSAKAEPIAVAALAQVGIRLSSRPTAGRLGE